MHASRIDERAVVSGVDNPSFIVFFYEERGNTWTTVAYAITGGDIIEVLDWAQVEATGTHLFSIAVASEENSGASLTKEYGTIWLLGVDPNKEKMTSEDRRQLAAMTERREHAREIGERKPNKLES